MGSELCASVKKLEFNSLYLYMIKKREQTKKRIPLLASVCCLAISACLVGSMVMPLAQVNDNVSNGATTARIMKFLNQNVGEKEENTTEENFNNATLNAKLNFLNDKLTEIEEMCE